MTAVSTPIQYPLIGGVRHSFSSVELRMAGLIFRGFKSIDHTRARSRTMVYGNSPDPIGKTRGKNEYKCSAEVYIAEWNAFQQALQAQAGLVGGGTNNGYGDVFFTIFVAYIENGFDTINDVVQGCTMDSTEASDQESTDPLVRKMEFSPLKILFNGLDDLAVPLISPPQ